MSEAEGVSLIMEAGYVPQTDSAKCPSDGRITAFGKEIFPKRLSRFLFFTEYGRQDQKTLVSVIIKELSLHERMRHDAVKRVKKRVIFLKFIDFNMVRDGGRVTSIKIITFL